MGLRVFPQVRAVGPAVMTIGIAVGCVTTLCAQTPGTAVNRFEPNVAAYEAADKAAPPRPGAILLVGDALVGGSDPRKDGYAGGC